MKMIAIGELVNDKPHVHVEEGGPSEKYWRDLGYVPESELEVEAGEDELDKMTVKELQEFVEARGLDVDLSSGLKEHKVARVRAALASPESED